MRVVDPREHMDGRLEILEAIIRADPERMRLLGLVSSLRLPDCWVAAGFVRNALWDALHSYETMQSYDDIDFVWFDRGRTSPQADTDAEVSLQRLAAEVRWSVKNQARMHLRNEDAPYNSTAQAMSHWVETSAAVAVRLDDSGDVRFSTPLGTDDLFGLVHRPGPRFEDVKYDIFLDRSREK